MDASTFCSWVAGSSFCAHVCAKELNGRRIKQDGDRKRERQSTSNRGRTAIMCDAAATPPTAAGTRLASMQRPCMQTEWAGSHMAMQVRVQGPHRWCRVAPLIGVGRARWIHSEHFIVRMTFCSSDCSVFLAPACLPVRKRCNRATSGAVCTRRSRAARRLRHIVKATTIDRRDTSATSEVCRRPSSRQALAAVPGSVCPS